MITSWVAMAVMGGVGVGKLYEWIGKREKNGDVGDLGRLGFLGNLGRVMTFETVAKVGLLATAFVPLLFWFPVLNRKQHAFATDYLTNMMAGVEKNAVVVGGGDYFDSVTAYEEAVGKARPDVTFITGNMFYIFPWYRSQIRQKGIVVSDALEEKAKIVTIPGFTDVIDQLIADNPERVFYITPLLLRESVVAGTSEGVYRSATHDVVPHGLLLEVVPKGIVKEPDKKLFDFSFQYPQTMEHTPIYMERNYAGAYRLL
jgi:hypothetical protein